MARLRSGVLKVGSRKSFVTDLGRESTGGFIPRQFRGFPSRRTGSALSRRRWAQVRDRTPHSGRRMARAALPALLHSFPIGASCTPITYCFITWESLVVPRRLLAALSDRI